MACSAAVVETRLSATSGAVKSAATSSAGDVVSAAFELMERGHADKLLVMVRDVMHRANVSFNDLDAIATAYGPGSFTGVRIAVACARALALSSGLPVFGFSSLALIAAKARHMIGDTRGTQLIGATMDARRNEIYVQLFDDPGKPPVTEPQVLPPTDAWSLSNQPIFYVGTGALLVKAAAAELGRDIDADYVDLLPDAAFSSCLHMERLDKIKPLYLRPPDAKPQAGKFTAAL